MIRLEHDQDQKARLCQAIEEIQELIELRGFMSIHINPRHIVIMDEDGVTGGSVMEPDQAAEALS